MGGQPNAGEDNGDNPVDFSGKNQLGENRKSCVKGNRGVLHDGRGLDA